MGPLAMKTIKMKIARTVDGKARKKGETFSVAEVYANLEVNAGRATYADPDAPRAAKGKPTE